MGILESDRIQDRSSALSVRINGYIIITSGMFQEDVAIRCGLVLKRIEE